MQTLWRYIKLSFLVGLLPVALVTMLVQCVRVSKIPSLENILKKKPAITTSISDAVTEVPFLDDFDPKDIVPMTVLSRTPDGGFILERPGLYVFEAQSYCLKAGTYAPSEGRGGEGYLYAPLKGPRADIIRNILRRSVDHPEIPQRDIQVLLWAIIARTKIGDMSREMQLTAARLLTPEEIFEINGGALGLIPEELLQKALAKLPPQARQVLEAEARLREMLTEGRATYEELERVAVLRGDPPPGEGDREVPRGRWSYHPDGFFIRYFPSGYTRTRIQIYVPESFQIERDALGRITSIADPFGNRIETDYDDTIELLRIPGERALKGYAFRSIRFEHFDPDNPGKKLRTEWTDVGWTFLGVPLGRGRVGTPSDRFRDLKERYEWCKRHKKELNDLEAGVKILCGGAARQGISKGGMEEIIDLGHYAVALEQAFSGDQAKKIKRAADHIDLVQKAWQYAVCKREGGYDGRGTYLGLLHGKDGGLEGSPFRLVSWSNPGGNNGGTSEYEPSCNDAVPGNTSRQRLGISPRPADDEDDKYWEPCDYAWDDIVAADRELEEARSEYERALKELDGYSAALEDCKPLSPGDKETGKLGYCAAIAIRVSIARGKVEKAARRLEKAQENVKLAEIAYQTCLDRIQK